MHYRAPRFRSRSLCSSNRQRPCYCTAQSLCRGCRRNGNFMPVAERYRQPGALANALRPLSPLPPHHHQTPLPSDDAHLCAIGRGSRVWWVRLASRPSTKATPRRTIQTCCARACTLLFAHSSSTHYLIAACTSAWRGDASMGDAIGTRERCLAGSGASSSHVSGHEQGPCMPERAHRRAGGRPAKRTERLSRDPTCRLHGALLGLGTGILAGSCLLHSLQTSEVGGGAAAAPWRRGPLGC